MGMEQAFATLTDALNETRAAVKAEPDVLFGTVSSVSGNTAQVTIDGDTAATPCTLSCSAKAGDRVTVIRRGTSACAVAKVGGDAPSESVTTTVNDIITPASGITVTSATYRQWGKVATLLISAKGLSGSNTNISVGTVASGKRPGENVYGTVNSIAASHAIVNSSGGMDSWISI